MRTNKEHTEFLTTHIQAILSAAVIYLFGSRTDDLLKGGDIDILVIGDRRLTGQEKREIKIAFYKKFGEQKIYIISYEKGERSNFMDCVLTEAVEI